MKAPRQDSDYNRQVMEPFTARSTWRLAAVALLAFFLFYLPASTLFYGGQSEPGLGVVSNTLAVAGTREEREVIHAFPDTREGIHVFNDQLATWNMSEAQFEFAALRYAGTQKVFASDIRRLRSHNPNFIVLNYRLGLGLGYRNVIGDCEPEGEWIQVIEGEKWVREFPDDPPEEWFYWYDGQQVFFCDWGWYLMDLADPSWKGYWKDEVLRQFHSTKADGVFVDGLFLPNIYGGERFRPNLPENDAVFEGEWSSLIEDFIAFGQEGDLAPYYLIPNIGPWLTGRDSTDYSGADGVFVEGFARWIDGTYFSPVEGDWQMQMNRILSLVNLDKIILLQQYVDETGGDDRLFLIGSYLLVKGSHTFINLELSADPEWFPIYEIPIGTPDGGNPASISSLWRSDWQVYARNYSRGLVLVNPSDRSVDIALEKDYYLALPDRGGIVPPDGDTSDWKVEYTRVNRVRLEPNRAAVLLDEAPED